MRRLPSSASRSQALVEFEPFLHKAFQRFVIRNLNPELRDAMHYALFSAKDRFCASAAWLIAPHVGITFDRLAPPLISLELLRCALLSRTKDGASLDPTLADTAACGLLALAFERLAAESEALKAEDKVEMMRIMAQAAMPARIMGHTSTRGEKLRTPMRVVFRERDEVIDMLDERAAASFTATGAILSYMVEGSDLAHTAHSRRSSLSSFKEGLASWFRKLGLFAHALDELKPRLQ